MVFQRLAAVKQQTVNLMINRFKTSGIADKFFRRFSGNGDNAMPPGNEEDGTTYKSAIKKIVKDLSRPSKPEPLFFGCEKYMKLEGKVALITGGTKGIGLAVAKDLVENGASRVVISGRDVKKGGKALKVLKDMCVTLNSGQKATYVPMDVTSGEELKELFDYTTKNMGGLDILVNSAAIMNESSSWRQMIDTNLRALIASTKLGVDIMNTSNRPGGVIVNLSAIFAIKPLPQMPIFSATKAGVRAATLGFSKMNNCNDLRIMTACMGPTNTPMLLNLSPEDIGEWSKDEQEHLLDILKAKQKMITARGKQPKQADKRVIPGPMLFALSTLRVREHNKWLRHSAAVTDVTSVDALQHIEKLNIYINYYSRTIMQ